MKAKFTKRKIPKVMFANCGHGETRRLEDCDRLGFISAGQGHIGNRKHYYFSNQIRNLIVGDILAVYRNKVGYVGIAKVLSQPMDINVAVLDNKPVTGDIFSKQSNMFRNSTIPGYAECMVKIRWLTQVHLNDTVGSGKCYGMFAKQLAICSLDNQKETRSKLEEQFKIKFADYLPNYIA